jgi:hypothetical protein
VGSSMGWEVVVQLTGSSFTIILKAWDRLGRLTVLFLYELVKCSTSTTTYVSLLSAFTPLYFYLSSSSSLYLIFIVDCFSSLNLFPLSQSGSLLQ